MKKLSRTIFILVFLSREAFAEDRGMGGMDEVFFDETYKISKSACLVRDPKNARETNEIWRKWEDENSEDLVAIRDLRTLVEIKFQQIGAGKNGDNPSEMERQAYTLWLQTHDFVLSRIQARWDKLTDDEVEMLCENMRAALLQPPLLKAGQDALAKIHRIWKTLQKEFP